MAVLGYEPTDASIAPAEHQRGLVVREVAPGSLGERLGMAAGDRLISINGEPIRDPIDLMFHAAEDRLTMRVLSEGSERPRTLKAEREPYEELGVVLGDFKIRQCNNQCVFCFIHQNPRGLRRGIYFKDGDFRMSFLHGNYITLTNLKDEDYERIIEQRLSPLYVSVHTTNHELRLRMLGNKQGPNVLHDLKRLARGRIDVHSQIVLCPGWNDGPELERTIKDLLKFRPHMLSVAIVPLGLSDHRSRLPDMAPVTPSFCRKVIDQITPIQKKLEGHEGEKIVYLSDEFYITANRTIPKYNEDDVLNQLENGVGMVAEFMAPWRSKARRLPERVAQPCKIALVTGLLGMRVLRRAVERLNRIENLSIEMIPCLNELFGRNITVSGLLAGADFLREIKAHPGFDRYLIPGNAVRAEGQVFLDDMTLESLNSACAGRVRAVDGDVSALVKAILG